MTRPAILALVACVGTCVPCAAQTVSSSGAATTSAVAPDATSPTPVLRDVDWSGEAKRLTVPGFGQLFSGLKDDVLRLPSKENAIFLTIGGALAGISAPRDRQMSDAFRGGDERHEFLSGGALLGSFPVQLGASFATYAIGRASGNSKLAIVGADLVRAQILAQGTTMGLKFIAGRTRPDSTDSHSFPSGHTSSAFATATVLERHYGWKVGIPAYAVAGYIGASRVNDGKHYFSDVAFGAALGIVAGRTVTLGIGNTKFALGPTVGPHGGVGIGLTKVEKK